MSTFLKELGSAPDDEDSVEIGIIDIIQDIKELIDDSTNPSNKLNEYIQKVEKHIEEKSIEELNNIDRAELRKQIEKHPYFKNPNSYFIRMITIMKYLKKKGLDVNIPDVDLLVEEIILEIDGVTKIGDGRFKKNRH